MHTTLDLSRYDDVTAYDDLPRASVVHVDYLPTPQAVSRRVREIIGTRHLNEERVAEEAHVDVSGTVAVCAWPGEFARCTSRVCRAGNPCA